MYDAPKQCLLATGMLIFITVYDKAYMAYSIVEIGEIL